MNKQNKNKNKSHLFESGGFSGFGDFGVSGTVGFVNGMKSTFDDVKQKSNSYNDQINNSQITDLSNINDLDTLENYSNSITPLDYVTTNDLSGNTKQRLGRYLSTSGQAAQAGSNYGPWGLLIGSVVGQIGAGLSDTFSRKKARNEKRKLNERIDFVNEQNQNTLANKANNIMQNQLSDQQWNYIAALGGNLHSNSTTWNNGLNYIGNGGSHESNPNDGVAISTAPDGLQNKVEEGEVIWNDDYVFSRRLKVPKKDLEKNKWKGETYADIAKKLMDESAERPNDPITLRGLDDSLSRLRDSQDELKAKQEGNKIKKEIASMPPELLAQIQQQAQQPTEEEMMQQQAMEQMPQEQMPMVDPSIGQSLMEQPPMYAKGGRLYKGAGKMYTEPFTAEDNYDDFHRLKLNSYLNDYRAENALYPTADLSFIEDKYKPGYVSNKVANTDDVIDALGRKSVFKNSKARKKYAEKDLQKSIDKITGKDEDNSSNDINWDSTILRYAPVVGSAIGAISSMLNKPDYDNPKRIERIAKQVSSPVSPKYIGDYLPYKPLDNTYYLNRLQAQQNANNAALAGLANGNRSMASANLLASNYNYNNAIGDAIRQGEIYNTEQRQRAAEFNRGTNQFNAQQYIQAAEQNAINRAQAANLIASAAQMREGIDSAYGASQSANWTNLFNNLGNVGRDEANRKMTKDLFDYGWSKGFNKTYNGATFKHGGYLTIKTNNRRKE